MDLTSVPELSIAKSKLLRKLQARKHRRQCGLFVAEGVRLVEEAVSCGAQIEWAVFTGADNSRCLQLLENLVSRTELYHAQAKELAGLLDCAAPQEVAAVCRVEQGALEELILADRSLVIVCDSVRDPGNFGAIVRTAAAAGCTAVIAAGEGVDPWNPKAVRGSMGALFRVPVVVADDPVRLDGFLKENQFTVYMADMHGQNLFRMQNVPDRCAVIIGGEAEGPGAFSNKLGAEPLAIPMSDGIESLNAAVAAGIIIYHLSRTQAGAGQ